MKRDYRAIIEVSGSVDDENYFEGANRFLQGIVLTSSDLKLHPLKVYSVVVEDNEEEILEIVESAGDGVSLGAA